VYVASGDPAKANRAEELSRAGRYGQRAGTNEITNVARRRWACRGRNARFSATIRGLLPVQPLTIGIHEAGLSPAKRYGLSTYGAMIARLGVAR